MTEFVRLERNLKFIPPCQRCVASDPIHSQKRDAWVRLALISICIKMISFSIWFQYVG